MQDDRYDQISLCIKVSMVGIVCLLVDLIAVVSKCMWDDRYDQIFLYIKVSMVGIVY